MRSQPFTLQGSGLLSLRPFDVKQYKARIKQAVIKSPASIFARVQSAVKSKGGMVIKSNGVKNDCPCHVPGNKLRVRSISFA